MSDLLVKGGRVVGEGAVAVADVLIRGGRIASVTPADATDAAGASGRGAAAGSVADGGVTVIDATGLLVFPGLVDPQVHFREPGLTHKEDLASGSLAAIAGGVTAFMEMPNTTPNTVDPAALRDKLHRAAGRTCADHAFFLGATAGNAERLGEWEQLPGCAGVKVFMGSSTGTLLIGDDATLERVLRSGSRRVAVHSEDEDRLRERYAAMAPNTTVSEHPQVRDVETAVRATNRLLDLVEKTGRKIHLLHVSTAEEVAILRTRDLGELVTAEVTPNHLFMMAPSCYERHGSLAQMNPPVRDQRHRDALRQGLVDGVIACIGSDHAPHTLAEKARPYPESPSGIPGVQTILPLLMTGVRDGWLTLDDVRRVGSTAAAAVYGIAGKGAITPGYDGDLVLVDESVRVPLSLSWLCSRAGYSPYVGVELAGWPRTTILAGAVAYDHHERVGVPSGRPLRFA